MSGTKEIAQKLLELPVIDWQRGQELMNNDLSEAVQLLRQLLNYIPEALQQILQAAQTNDSNELLSQVHKLHGACSYCGVPRLKLAAKSLELALRRQQSNEIPELMQTLQDETYRLLNAAKQDNILNA